MQNIFLTKVCFIVKISDNYMQFSKCPICGKELNSQEQRNKAQIYKDSGCRELLQKYTILRERYNDLKQGYVELRLKLQRHVATESEWRLKRASELKQLSRELITKNRELSRELITKNMEIIKLQKALETANAKISSRDSSSVNSSNTELTFGQKKRIIGSLGDNLALQDCDKPASIINNHHML